MRVVKPQTLSVLYRVLDDPREARLVVVVLGFFAFGRERLLPEAALWTFAATELGKDASLDECLPKTRSEILVSGRCYAHGAGSVRASHVRVTVAGVDKRLAVVGDRTWNDGVPSAPEPFVEMPITWERAFGGPQAARNPVGKGAPPLPHMRSAFPLPNVETWGRLIRGPTDTPDPAGLLPIDAGWPQRMSKAGTYGEAWLRERFPGFADDMGPAYLQAAPADQQFDGGFPARAPFRFENMHPRRRALEGSLPELATRAFVEQRVRGERSLREVALRLDTVWFFPHAERGVLAFRGVFPVAEDDAADIETLLVASEAPGSPRTMEGYRDTLARRRDPDKGFIHDMSDKGLVPEWSAGADLLPDERSEVQDLLATEGLQQRNAQRGAKRARSAALAEARAALEAQGLDADTYIRPPEPIAPLPDPSDVEAVLARIEDEERQATARAGELETLRAEMEGHARRACEEAGVDYDAAVASAKREASAPPRPRADEQLERLRASLAEAKEQGAAAPELEAKLASGDLETMLRDADRATREMYQRTAHLMAAPPSREEGEASSLREIVRMRVAAGESLEGLDLTGVDLSEVDLRGADCEGALLAGAILRGAQASRSKWRGAVLAHADLTGINLERAALEGVNLGAAKLGGARLREADLGGAILRAADLSGADLTEAVLRDADLSETTFREASLAGAVLSGQSFLKCDLRKGSFARAELARSSFIEANLSGADFEGADLEMVTLVDCRADGARFSRARMHKTHAVGGCSFVGADLQGACLTGAFLRGAKLNGARLDGADLRDADLSECSLREASLRNANARDATFVRADLTLARMGGVDLLGASLSKAAIRGADLHGANLFRADLSRVALDWSTNLAKANVKQSRIWPKRRSRATG